MSEAFASQAEEIGAFEKASLAVEIGRAKQFPDASLRRCRYMQIDAQRRFPCSRIVQEDAGFKAGLRFCAVDQNGAEG